MQISDAVYDAFLDYELIVGNVPSDCEEDEKRLCLILDKAQENLTVVIAGLLETALIYKNEGSDLTEQQEQLIELFESYKNNAKKIAKKEGVIK